MNKTLSHNIQNRIDHCMNCHGSGQIIKKDYDEPLACMECADWKVYLRQVETLERELNETLELLRKLIGPVDWGVQAERDVVSHVYAVLAKHKEKNDE